MSSKPTDELLAALPDVGLRLWMLTQTEAGWSAAVYDPKHPMNRWEAEAYTPAAALVCALRDAGVEVTDET